MGWDLTGATCKRFRRGTYKTSAVDSSLRPEPVTVEQHRRAVVVVLKVEEYEHLAGAASPERERDEKPKKREE